MRRDYKGRNWIKDFMSYEARFTHNTDSLNLISSSKSKFIIEVHVSDNCYDVISGNNPAQVYSLTLLGANMWKRTLWSSTLVFLRNLVFWGIPVMYAHTALQYRGGKGDTNPCWINHRNTISKSFSAKTRFRIAICALFTFVNNMYKNSIITSNVENNPPIDFVVQIKCQKMSHAVRYNCICIGRNYRHSAFVVLIQANFIQDLCTSLSFLRSWVRIRSRHSYLKKNEKRKGKREGQKWKWYKEIRRGRREREMKQGIVNKYICIWGSHSGCYEKF